MSTPLAGMKFESVSIAGHSGMERPIKGDWTFVSDGAGCMYPRFETPDGDVIPWHAAIRAKKAKT